MEHITALLLIVGCSPDLVQCKELPAPTAIYESFDECQAQLPFSLQDMNGKADRVMAKCVFVDPAGEEADAELNWDVSKEGVLQAAVTFPDPAAPDPVLTSSVDDVGDKRGRIQ